MSPDRQKQQNPTYVTSQKHMSKEDKKRSGAQKEPNGGENDNPRDDLNAHIYVTLCANPSPSNSWIITPNILPLL